AFFRAMADGDAGLLRAVADAGACFLGAMADFLRHVAGGMADVAGAVGHAVADGLRVLLDAAALLRLRGRAERHQRGTGEHDAAERLAIHAGHLVSHGTPGRFYGSRLKPLLRVEAP